MKRGSRARRDGQSWAVRVINREVTRIFRRSKAKTGGVDAWRLTRGTDDDQAVV